MGTITLARTAVAAAPTGAARPTSGQDPHRRRPRAVPGGHPRDPRARAGLRDRAARPRTRAARSSCDPVQRPTSSCWTSRCRAPGGIEIDPAHQARGARRGHHRLAVAEDEDQLFDAIKAGAAAFILKDVGPDDLVTIIRRVSAGEYLINDKVFASSARRQSGPQGVPRPGGLRTGSGAHLRARCHRARSRSWTTSPRA